MFQTQFQISFPVLDKTFYIFQGKPCSLFHFLVRKFLQEEIIHADTLLLGESLNTILQCFFPFFILSCYCKMKIIAKFHKRIV